MKEDSQNTLFKNALLLVLRGAVMATQLSGKRAILGKKDSDILGTFGTFSGLEGLIFVLVYGSFGIINARIATAHGQIEMLPDEARHTARNRIGRLFQQGMIFAMGLMIPVGMIVYCAPMIFRLAGQSEEVIEGSRRYFFYAFFSYVLDSFYRCFARTMIGLSEMMFPLVADSAEAVVDLALTDAFANGRLGLPEMGVNAAAMAYMIAAGVTALGSYSYLRFYRKDLAPYALFQKQPELFDTQLWKMCKDGLHLGLSYSVEFFSLMLLTFYIGFSGKLASVGLQVALSYNYFLTLVLSGLAEAASTLIGFYIKQNPLHAKELCDRVYVINVGIASFSGIAAWVWTPAITRLFLDGNTQHEDVVIIWHFLRLQALIEVPNAIRNTALSIVPSCESSDVSDVSHAAHLGMKYLFYLTVSPLFMLNCALATLSVFVAQFPADQVYATQSVGYVFAAIGSFLVNRWQMRKAVVEAPRLGDNSFRLQIESPRHNDDGLTLTPAMRIS